MADKRAGRLHQPGASETPWLVVLGFIAAAVLLGGAWFAAAGLDSTVTAAAETTNPLHVVGQQLQGNVGLGSTQLVLFGLFALVLTLIGALPGMGHSKQSALRSRVDHFSLENVESTRFCADAGQTSQSGSPTLRGRRYGVSGQAGQ